MSPVGTPRIYPLHKVRTLRAVALLLLAGAIATASLVGAPRTTRALVGANDSCFGNLNASPYPSGFSAANFSAMTSTKINSDGSLQLDTALSPLDPTHIVLPFDQRLSVKYVYRNSGASHTVGWFYLDQLQPFLDKPASDPTAKLVDADADGVPDFFQTQATPLRPNMGLFQISSGQTIPDLFNSALGWSDGGTYPHLPNLLENIVASGGGIIFKIDDDDGDYSVQGPWSSMPGSLANDGSNTNDGIPDYDVNGDGTIGNAADRTVDLGVVQGNREIVFWANFYYDFNMRQQGIGLPVAAGKLQMVQKPGTGGAASGDVIKFAPTSSSSASGNSYIYQTFATGAQAIVSGDCIEYDVYLDDNVTGIGGIDIGDTDGTYWRDESGWKDQNNITGHPNNDLRTYAYHTWYHRKLAVPATRVGKTTAKWDFVNENDTAGQSYAAYIDNLSVTTCSSSAIKQVIYASGGPTTNSTDFSNGFTSAGAASTTYPGKTVPWFTKPSLNPDFGAFSANTVIRRVAIGCSRDDSTCYTSKHDSNGNAANLGWMDASAISRLNTANYHNLVLDDTVVNVSSDANGNTPHFIVAAPATDPNRWLLAFDDQPGYPGGTDYDYNDSVFMVERTNGGEVVSKLISSDIPAANQSDTVISKVRVRFAATFPSPGCDGVTDAEIRIYYSVDNKVTWRQVTFPAKTAGDVTIDVLGAGVVGNQLYWKADFVSSSQQCNPQLGSLQIGYEAIEHGEFKFAAPVPLANLVYTGTLETPPFAVSEPAVSRNDYSIRGHFRAVRLYDPTNPNATTVNNVWDAGQVLSAKDPSTRSIYTSVNGAATAFTTANGSTLYPLILSATARADRYNGLPTYDMTGDKVADDNDARFLLEWTRGWEYASGVTMTPSQTTTRRAWPLGALHNSSPTIVGPPPRPTWMDGGGAPPSVATLHNSFRAANATRNTLAVVGAQDGMIHAFNAGQFRYTPDTTCAVSLLRGCFTGSTDVARYGTGDEVWAYIPPSQLGQLRNNHPQTHQLTSAATAEVDGSVSVEDINVSGAFRTIAFASLGRAQPYVTAVDISGTTPSPLWANDFYDSDFHGSELSPSVGFASRPSADKRFIVAITSGLASSALDEYLYELDAATGSVLTKTKLNTGSASAKAYGFAGYPNLVDTDQDGLIDRVYAVDTSGRLFKRDLTSGATCAIANLGESVYSGMSVLVTTTGSGHAVKLFVGGGPNPDGSGSVASGYHMFAFQDDDPIGACTSTGASLVYQQLLPTGQKIWASPFVGADQVFYASAATTSLSVCQSADGTLFAMPTSGDGAGNPTSGQTSLTLSGSPVSSIRVYDGHVLVNVVGGKTTVIGGQTWNNAPSTNNAGGQEVQALRGLSWSEN